MAYLSKTLSDCRYASCTPSRPVRAVSGRAALLSERAPVTPRQVPPLYVAVTCEGLAQVQRLSTHQHHGSDLPLPAAEVISAVDGQTPFA